MRSIISSVNRALKNADHNHSQITQSSDKERLNQLSNESDSDGHVWNSPEDLKLFMDNYLTFVADLRKRCLKARDGQFNAAKYWDKVNRCLGLLAAIFGIIAGSSAFVAISNQIQNGTIVAGFFSILAGLFAAANSFLEPSERHQAHKRAGDEWSILRDQFAKLGQLEVYQNQSPEVLLSRLDELLVRKENVTRGSPVMQERFYLKAEKFYNDHPPGSVIGH